MPSPESICLFKAFSGRCEVLVFLLFFTALSLGNRFHEISLVGVAAEGQQSGHSGEQHIEGDNGPSFVCRGSVCEGSAGVKRCSDMTPLSLG